MNLSIFTFPKISYFIFEPRLSSYHYSKLLDKNSIKPNNDEISILKNNINDKSKNQNNNNMIFINKNLQQIILNTKKIIPKKDDKALLIEKIIDSNSEKGHISVRKITTEYNKICTNLGLNKISKSSVYRIIKNILLLSYRKTIIKNNKSLSKIILNMVIFS